MQFGLALVRRSPGAPLTSPHLHGGPVSRQSERPQSRRGQSRVFGPFMRDNLSHDAVHLTGLALAASANSPWRRDGQCPSRSCGTAGVELGFDKPVAGFSAPEPNGEVVELGELFFYFGELTGNGAGQHLAQVVS